MCMAVLIAVLSRRSPVGAIPVAFAFGVLITGSDSLQRSVNLPSASALVFQAVIVLSVLFFEALRSQSTSPRALLSRRAA
jgi:ABC-type uncharacterized transport system permease subunit